MGKYPGQPSTKAIRRRIRSICQNYTNPWDIIAELLQNSVDAIRRLKNKGHEKKRGWQIVIIFNYETRTIVVMDNGAGFPGGKWEELLNPDGTDKDDEEDEVGEKGVGLKFCIFSCGHFHLRSISEDGHFTVNIEGAHDWLESDTDEFLEPDDTLDDGHERKNDPDHYQTIVEIFDFSGPFKDESQHLDIFSQTPETIIYWIQTYTSIGQVGAYLDLTGEDIDISVSIKFVGDPPEWPDISDDDSSDDDSSGADSEDGLMEEAVVEASDRSIRVIDKSEGV